MNKRSVAKRRQFPLGVVFSLFVGVSIVLAQGEIVPVRDILGGTSVFQFKGKSKSVSKQFATQGRARRSKQQRVETARKVSTQYTRLAKVTPRRVRVDEVDPNDPRLQNISRMPRDQASRLFAGVGEYYMDLDEYDKAIDFFRESVQLDAQNENAKTGLSEALALKGNQLLVRDSVAVAQKFFEEALQHNPRNSPAYFGLAEVFSEQGDDQKSVANYEKALEFDKELTEIYSPLGVLYYQQAMAPENAARAAQWIAKADDLLNKAAAANPNDSQAQYYIGLIRLGQGKNSEALSAFTKAKTADPSYAEAFYYAGEANARMNNNLEATVEFRKAIQLRDNYFEAWYGLGSALFEMDKYEEAIIAFERAKRLKNDNAEVVANLGDAYRQLGRYDQAASNYNLATIFFERQKDFSKDAAARDLTADIYGRKGYSLAKDCELKLSRNLPCSNWDAAVQSIEKASQLNASSLNYANLGWAYSNAGRADLAANRTAQGRERLVKARDYLQKAIDANPSNVEGPLLNLGMVYTDLGDYGKAIDTLKQVIQREPKWVFAINELGLAYMNNKNYKDAIAQFKKAVDRDDKFAAAVYNLGHAQFKDGNVGEAKKAYQRLRSMGQATLATKLELVTGGAVRG